MQQKVGRNELLHHSPHDPVAPIPILYPLFDADTNGASDIMSHGIENQNVQVRLCER